MESESEYEIEYFITFTFISYAIRHFIIYAEFYKKYLSDKDTSVKLVTFRVWRINRSPIINTMLFMSRT